MSNVAKKILNEVVINTPLGEMIAIADKNELYLLEFSDRINLPKQINKLKSLVECSIEPGFNSVLENIENELNSYFKGTLKKFMTPVKLIGTDFQRQVWQALLKIPIGSTQSYLELACSINKPSGCRAVALANSLNRLAIIVPCHRVINSSGKLGGYAGGLDKKIALLEQEKNII